MDDRLKQFQTRKSRVESTIILGVLTLVVSALLFVFDGPTVLVVATVIVGAITVFFGYSSFVTVQDDFKQSVLKELLEDSVDNGYYDPKQGLSETQVYQSEALSKADHFKSEDFLSGSIMGVSFVSSDVFLMRLQTISTGKSTTTTYVPYFTGRVFSFEFNKTFEGALQVLEEGKPQTQRPYKTLEMESDAFNDRFRIFATNDHSAFYVLTPHMMEALMKIENNHPGKLSFSFVNSKFFVAINNDLNTFELKMFRPINQTSLEAFKKDLAILHDIVTTLKLNRKIFEKETYDFTQS